MYDFRPDPAAGAGELKLGETPDDDPRRAAAAGPETRTDLPKARIIFNLRHDPQVSRERG